jgi:hypothetical protein
MFGFNTYLLVILSRDGLTGSKFEVKIWTLIGGSCLGLLQTKTMSTLTKKKIFCQISMKKNKQVVL